MGRKVSELVSQQIENVIINSQTWGGIMINIATKGAVGDGVKDNSIAIQEALDEAEEAGGGVVFAPAAVNAYNFSAQLLIPDGVYLLGAGSDLVTLNYTGKETQGIVIKPGTDYYKQLLGGFKLTGESLIGGGTTQFHENMMVSRFSGRKYALICGVIRYDTTNGWYLQDDENHNPIGISVVGVVGSRVRISYDFNAKAAVSLVITPDDALAQKGYAVSGCGVGLSSSEFRYGRMVDIYGRASYDTATSKFIVGSGSNNTDYPITFEDRGGGVIRVHHDEDDIGFLPTMLTGTNDSYTPRVGLFAGTYFDVKFYDMATGTQVTTFDANCSFHYRRGGYTFPDVTEGYPYIDGNFFCIGIMEV